MTCDLHDRLGEAVSTLLCVSSLGGGAEEACIDLLAPDEADHLLWITTNRSPDDCLDSARGSDATLSVVAVGDSVRSTAATSGGNGGIGAGPVVEAVGSVDDLTGLGIAIDRRLNAADGDVRVCFDSLTALLQYVEEERAYEFLHSLCGRLYAHGARAHFHVDPAAHDDRTVARFTSLCDAKVTVSDDDREVHTAGLPDGALVGD